MNINNTYFIISYKGSKPINIVWKLRYKLPANIESKAEQVL
ncbi:MAG: hypothetical protein ACRCXT_21815 [Paraclostridium sp.]